MLKELNNSNSVPIGFSITKGKSIDSIMNFLEAKLPFFTKNIQTGLKHEDDISQDCCIFLNREARETFFMFHFQYKYIGQKRSSDMSAISAEKFESKDPLIVIEAKRLPTPGSKREREYVQGNLGGIERFKRGFHGSGLQKSVVLGYVQMETFSHWHNRVCSWINDLINSNPDTSINWNSLDLLKFNTSIKGINKYSSSHSRVGEQSIELIHYWIYTN